MGKSASVVLVVKPPPVRPHSEQGIFAFTCLLFRMVVLFLLWRVIKKYSISFSTRNFTFFLVTWLTCNSSSASMTGFRAFLISCRKLGFKTSQIVPGANPPFCPKTAGMDSSVLTPLPWPPLQEQQRQKIHVLLDLHSFSLFWSLLFSSTLVEILWRTISGSPEHFLGTLTGTKGP